MEDRTVFQPTAFGSLRPGVRLNGIFEIEKFITQGGMGEVYRGFNIQTGDPVAIKMIRPELASNPEVFELFRREAKTLHNLAHEAIVRYFVFTIDPGTGRAYLSMEFVEGPSLTEKLVSGPMPLADIRILQTRIGSALEAAHRLGVIHRDISPDNIILPGDEVRNAKVIDFGIARSLQRTEATIIGGGFAGKYNYASPEQFGLAGGEVTFKSDIYSFGLVLAAALRGRPIDMSGSDADRITKRSVVPDLSDIDPSIRPLIRAMLQPLPADRPASMAAVAAWAPSSASSVLVSTAPPAGAAPTPRASAGGRTAAILGAVIALASIGGAAYVFRDDLAQWSQPQKAPTAPPVLAKLPPIAAPPTSTQIPPLAPPQAPAEGNAPPATPEEKTTESAPPPSAPPSKTQPAPNEESQAQPNPLEPHPPRADEIAEAAPPRAPQPVIDLSPATVGAPYRAELPVFTDPGGKGLRLAANGVPEGMTFNDAGVGKGVVEGAPTQAGPAAIEVIATNHNGQSAQMTARIAIADKAKPTVGSKPTETKSPLPEPPVGGALAPEGPIATSPSQQTHGQTALLEPPRPSPDKRSEFLETFDGGDCFLVKPIAGAEGTHSYLAVGRELAPFRRFETAYTREVGAEPQLSLRLITASECPVLDLIRPGAGGAAEVPAISLTSYSVSRGRPLAGTVSNLAGRRLYLILVDNDGAAYRLETKPTPGGDAATFSAPLVPDASSVGPLQTIVAIVSEKPIPELETFRSGPLKAIAPGLMTEARNGSVSAQADFFTFAN